MPELLASSLLCPVPWGREDQLTVPELPKIE